MGKQTESKQPKTTTASSTVSLLDLGSRFDEVANVYAESYLGKEHLAELQRKKEEPKVKPQRKQRGGYLQKLGRLFQPDGTWASS